MTIQRQCGSWAQIRRSAAWLLLAALPGVLDAQAVGTPSAAPSTTPSTAQAQAKPETNKPEASKPPRNSDRRKAAKLFMASSKLFLDRRFEEAMKGYEQAAALDPENANYPRAAEVARGHAVTALIQAAAKDRLLGDAAGARAALEQARTLDPKNIAVSQHMDELGDDALLGQTKPLYEEQSTNQIGEAEALAPSTARHSFHLRADQRQTIQQVFQAYGLTAMLDESVHPMQVRFDLDEATFDQAAHALELATKSFYSPLDAHRVVVAGDTRENRQRFTRLEMETVYLSGLSDTELTEIETVAKNVFGIQKAKANPTSHTLTLRGPSSTLQIFNATLRSLLDGRSQVLLDVRMIQVSHTGARVTGVQLPQTMTAFNLYAEEQSILSQNSTLVQEIISSGLASANDPLAILAILIASGEVSSTLLSSGFAVFGGGITESALEPGSATLNIKLNTTNSHALDQIQLRLQDGEEGTIKEGERYPIQTSSYSGLSSNSTSIAGLTSSGTSSALSSLISSLSSSASIPMVQYEDLGLTLKTTPRVLRNGNVALGVNMKLDSLSGSTLSGNPILNNRVYSGDVIVKEGEATVIATELDKTQSRALSGTPGLSEIPGLSSLSSNDKEIDTSTLVIVITPHVVRGSQAAGHTAMMRVEKGAGVQ
jgi:Flp pilus assembly secretin CpaC/tetratricopeptide (TPR) repeat protein